MNAPELIATVVAVVVVLRGLYLATLTEHRKRFVLRVVGSPHLNKIGIASLIVGSTIFYYSTRDLTLAVKVGAFVGAVVMFNALFMAFPRSYVEFVRGYFGQSEGMIRLQGLLLALIGLVILYSLGQGL